jgi:hypothetical protein
MSVSPQEYSDLQYVFLSKTNSILTWENVFISMHLIHMVYFGKMHMFLQPSWIVLFGTKWAYVHLENYDL